jgi:collagenase-like PrtC family protease
MELTLGPVLFDWKRKDLLKFYKDAARMAVDTVYLGEAVCSRRRGLTLTDIKEIADMLKENGKKVYLSTLAIVSTEEELSYIRELCALGFAIEANDISAVSIALEKGLECAAGPHITTYNTDDIAFLRRVGVTRVTFPVELPDAAIEYNAQKSGIFTEVFAHGKVPLAFSWRCYTSRAFGLKSSNCEFDCRKYPDGMEINSLDDEPIFTINGKSILSNNTYTLIDSVDELKSMGVGALRISPQSENTGEVIMIFNEKINGSIGGDEALARVREISGQELCNGWFRGKAGKDYLEEIEQKLAL